MTSGVRLSLVIPCYNEAKNLPLLVARLRECIVRDDVEVVLVDNGSTDASPQLLATLLADQAQLRCVRVEVNQGYGYGILAGLRATRGEVIGWTHADLQTDPADALRALEAFGPEAPAQDVFVKGRRQGRPLGDTVFTVGMSIFESLLLGRRLWDINAQPTLFPKAFFATWRDPPHDFSLDLYAYYEAKRQRLKIARIPVTFGARAHGVSHWNVNWRAKLRFIARTVRYSIALRRALRGATP